LCFCTKDNVKNEIFSLVLGEMYVLKRGRFVD